MSRFFSLLRRTLSYSILAVAASFGGESTATIEAPARDAAVVRNRPSDSSERGVGAGAGWDIEADRAYLAVSPGGAQVATPAPGQTVFFHTDWFVSGSGGSQTYLIRALLDGSVFCTGSATLESGSFTIWCNDGWRATSGLHTLRWEIDYTDTIAETDEGNNSSSRTWATGSLLDIAAVDAFLRTAPNGGDEVATPTLGQPVFLHLRLQASGFAGDLSVPAQARLDGTVFCGGNLTVQVGSRVVWCNQSWNATAGDHTLQWLLDPDDVIAENDEQNNGVFTQWTTSAGETPTALPTDTIAPTTAATATRTPTRTTASATPTPTGTVLTGEGFFARGDSNCSLTLTAADVVAQVRGLGGSPICDNDDCDRDGSVTDADVDCAARCLFGICPVPPHAPQVTAVQAESTTTLVPFSTARVQGSFGTQERTRSVRVGGRLGDVVTRDGDDLLIVVPDLAPGTYDLVLTEGDVAGAPVPVRIEAAQPIGTEDTLEGFSEQVIDAVTLILDSDMDAIYGDSASFVRRELEALRADLGTALAELLQAPGFEELRGPIDAAIEGSGLPEQLRQRVAELTAAQADGIGAGPAVPLAAEATRQVATVIYVAGRTTVFAVTRVLPAAAAATAKGAGLVLATKVIVVGAIGVAVVGGVLWAQDTPVIDRADPWVVEPGKLLTVWGRGLGGLVEPNLVMLFPQSGHTQTLRDAEEAGDGWLKFRIPEEVGVCGQAEMYLEVPITGKRAPGNFPLWIQPVLVDISATFVEPRETLQMNVRGVAGCARNVTALYRQDEGEGLSRATELIPLENEVHITRSRVPRFVPGRYGLSLDIPGVGVRSANEEVLNIRSGLDELEIDCDLEPMTGVVIGAKVRCIARGIPKDADLPELGEHQYAWTVHDGGDLVEVTEVAGFRGQLVDLIGKRPGTAELSVELQRTDLLPSRFIARSSENATISFIEWNPPTITLQTDTPEIVAPGATIQVLAKAEDDFEMQKIVLQATGDAVPDDRRLQEYQCPTFGIPGLTSRKCEHEFQFDLKEMGFRPEPITVSAIAIDGSNNQGRSNELTFRFEIGEVTGTVFDADTGDPIQDVILQLLTEGGAVFDTVVSGGGGFLFEDVPAATYTLTAVADGFEPGQTVVIVVADTTTPVDIFLEPLGPLTVELRKIAESPPSTANVRYARSAIEDGTVVYTFFDSSDRDSTAIYVNRGAGNQIVAGTTNIIPNVMPERTFSSFGDLALDGDIVAFTTNLNGRLYRRNLNVPNFPEAVEEFLRLPGNFPDPFIMVYDGGRVGVGLGNPSTSSLRAIYTAKDGGIDPRQPQSEFLHLVADTDTAIPGGQGTFTVFRFNGDQDVAFEATGGFGADTIAFIGEGDQGQAGVYRSAGGGALEVIADTNTPMPDGLGPFDRFRGVAMDGGAVVFTGQRTDPVQVGLYMVSASGLRRIADQQTTVPGRTSVFRSFDATMAFDAGIVAFDGAPDRGDGAGVYIEIGGTLSKVLVQGDTLDGKVVAAVNLHGDDALDGDGIDSEGIDLVMEVFFEDGSRALYAASVK